MNKCFIVSSLLEKQQQFLLPCRFIFAKLSLVKSTFRWRNHMHTLIFSGTSFSKYTPPVLNYKMFNLFLTCMYLEALHCVCSLISVSMQSILKYPKHVIIWNGGSTYEGTQEEFALIPCSFGGNFLMGLSLGPPHPPIYSSTQGYILT